MVVLASASAWAIIFVAIPYERQDFPLADDWAYARGAIRFAHGEGLHFLNWAPMPQLAQWLWAAPFLRGSGDSLAALRVGMILLSWLGLWAFYDLLRQEGFSEGQAALGSATLALHPLFFIIQGSFMTDVPSLTLCLVALAFYGRALKSGRAAWLWPAAAAAILAAINRQNTIAAPAAAGLLVLGRREWRWRPAWLAAVVIPALVAVLAHKWFTARPDAMLIGAELPDRAQSEALPFVMVLDCGLASLPVLLLRPWPRPWRLASRVGGIVLAALAGVAALAVMLGCANYWQAHATALPRGGLFPYIDGHINWFGVYSEATVLGGQFRPIILTGTVRVLLTLGGCLAGGLLLTRIFEAGRDRRLWGLLPLFTLLGIPLIYASPHIFDRRLLFLFPGAILMGLPVPSGPRVCWVASLAALGLFAAAALGLTHDSLAWNAARWDLGRRAVARGIHPWEIEGGFEWDGWYAPEGRPAPPDLHRAYRLGLTRQQFTHVTGRYGLSFVRSPETPVLDSEPYTQWLAPGPREFYLIELPTDRPAGSQEGKR